MILSIEEYAQFVENAYSNNLSVDTKLNGWDIIKTNYGINGFQAIALGQDNNDDGLYDEVIIVYRGTDSFLDLAVDDFRIVLQNIPIQAIGAINFYKETIKNIKVNPNANVTLTGHSLGGGLAQIVGSIYGIETLTFNAPGMKKQLEELGYDTSLSYNYINNYIIMNDYVGNYGEHIGNEYYYEPIPIKDNTFLDTHNGILPQYGFNIEYNQYFTLPNKFGDEEAISLWYYDTNNSLRKSGIGALSSLVSEEHLKNAIDIINEYIGEPIRQLSYTINNGAIIIDSKFSNNKDITITSSKSIAILGCNDIIYGNSQSDVINGLSGNDILIGDSTTYKVRDLENFRDNIDELRQNPYSIDVTKFEDVNDGNDELYGGSGDDILVGGGGQDYLDGGKNADIIYGGSGDDTIIGGKGNDILVGGEGYDKYIINSGDGCDTIYDSALLQDSDGKGHIRYNDNILHGSIMKEPIGGVLWIDSLGNTYFWNGQDGSDLIINGTTTVKSFENGKTLEIYLGRYNEPLPEEFNEFEQQMYPPTIKNDNPKNDPLTRKIRLLYPEFYYKYLKAIESNGIPSDPIILDIDGNGIQIANDGAYFDYDGDGYAEATGWISGDDALLVNDKNNNGIIDDGSEVLVHDTLAEYDSNNDGIIDENDEQYNELKVLRSNGTLQSLLEAGVKFISLNKKDTNYIDEYGNTQFAQGTFTKIDGSINEYGEFLLQTDTTNALEKEQIEVSDDVLELPEIKNWGKSSSLHQAIMKDETGSLKTLVESFVNEASDENRMKLVDKILEKWANASDVEDGSRGEFIDAKKLAIIETFMGLDFYSENEGEETPQNPNQEAGQYLTTLYEQLKTYIYAELMSQTHISGLLENIIINFDLENGFSFDFTQIVSILLSPNNHSIRQQSYYSFTNEHTV
jgi:Ca2+-binding RTX toxin-like protein